MIARPNALCTFLRHYRPEKANWLQNAFVNSVYALGGRCHGFGEWNPCPVERLLPEERVHVEFNSG